MSLVLLQFNNNLLQLYLTHMFQLSLINDEYFVIYLLAKCGKVLAGWTTDSAGNMLGGHAPDFGNILHKPNEFKLFCKSLFREDRFLSEQVKQFLACAVLRFYKDFLVIIEECPDEKFINPVSHPLVAAIKAATIDAGCNNEDMNIWTCQLNEGFINDNLESLSLAQLQKLNPDGSARNILVDQRSIINVVQDVTNATNLVVNKLVDMEKKWHC